MFKSNKAPALAPETDYTKNLRETSFYRYGHLRSLGLTGEVTAIAIEPLLSLFAVGTSSGLVHVFGQAAFQFTLPVSGSSSSSPAVPIKFLCFHPGHQRIVIIDESNTIHTYSLQNISDHANPLTHPPLPIREGAYTMYGTITAIDQPLPSHTHLFFTMKDGSTLAWDLSRRVLGNWKTHNCWGEYEERMVRSGIPGRHRTIGGPMPTCLAVNPRDLNVMLIGYEGGVVAWDFQKGAVVKTFEMVLPPGAPGGGTYDDAGSLWTERTPSVTCVAWRSDGQVFAVGHSDGCISFWAFSESDKPLSVRTITHEDVNVTDAESLFSAGALDNQIRKGDKAEFANREPVFKLAWASFPDAVEMKLMIAAQGPGTNTGEPISNATHDYAERGETLLVILGGQSAREKPGINILQFPQYQPALAKPKGTPQSPSEGLPPQDRYAFRDSLMPTGSSYYPTKTPPEDFVLIPRSNPYFNLSHDPVALVVTLTTDSSLPKVDASCAARTVEAWVFPPPRSTIAPPSTGRKSFAVPGEEEKLVAMTPAPMLAPKSPTPRSPSPATPGWRLPWTAATPSPRGTPQLRVPSTDSLLASPFGSRKVKNRRKLRVPSSLWSGSLTMLGCELFSVPTPTFKRLISWSIENAGSEDEPPLPLYGGMAVPDLQSHGAPDVKVAKLESYRLMATFHVDATVRFWDLSPHLLLLPTPLRFEYPGALPHLTISIGDYLRGVDVAHLPLAKLWQTNRSAVRIKSIHLARDSLECVITMATGEVIVTKFGEAKAGAKGEVEELDQPSDSYFPATVASSPPDEKKEKDEWVEEVTEIGHLAKWKEDGFKPVAIFTLKRGEAVQCAVSDIGFIAVAFASNSLAVLDMRGPDVILREGFDEEGAQLKKKKKKGNVQNVVGETSPIGSMKWAIAGLGIDPTPRPRLIVSYAKGMTKIYTLANVLGEWLVETKPPTFTNESLAGPLASFVLNPTTGNELVPTAELLANAMRTEPSSEKNKDAPPHCLWIAASKRSIRCAVNFNGERVAKVELGEDEELVDVLYVTRHGNKILVAITSTGDALFYTVPFLEPISRMHLYYGVDGRRIGKLSFDDRSGDFLEYSSPLEVNLRTVFHFRKPLPPRIDPCTLKRAVPAQPVPVNATSYAASWIWGGAPLTGAQLDAMVAGPNRPPAPKPPPAPKQPLISWGKPPEEPVKPVATPAAVLPTRTAVKKQVAPLRDAREREDAYTEMRNAAAERGTYLDSLGDSLNNVSISAANYVSQARNAAMKEAAKGTVKATFGKLF